MLCILKRKENGLLLRDSNTCCSRWRDAITRCTMMSSRWMPLVLHLVALHAAWQSHFLPWQNAVLRIKYLRLYFSDCWSTSVHQNNTRRFLPNVGRSRELVVPEVLYTTKGTFFLTGLWPSVRNLAWNPQGKVHATRFLEYVNAGETLYPLNVWDSSTNWQLKN